VLEQSDPMRGAWKNYQLNNTQY